VNDAQCPHRGEAATHLLAPPRLRHDQALFLDFDGTLAEIAPSPGLVRVPARLPRLLGELADRLAGAVALVSGRSLDDLARMVAPFEGALAGQHGLERRCSDGSVVRCPAEPALQEIRAALAGFAAQHAGIILEDKGGSLALHYRQVPSAEVTCRELVGQIALASRGAFEALEGKMVIELRPRSCGKGRAIEAFLAEMPFHGRVPVFIGDDVTDEDGFVVVNQLGGVSVKVGDAATSAHYRLPTVDGVLTWLAQGLAH
jgi:trehalose 6-phosphate phosphatase